MKVKLPLKYMNLEIGDLVDFDAILGGVKPYGIDYTANDSVNNQTVFKNFLITSTNKTLEWVEIECIQMHNLDTTTSYVCTNTNACNYDENGDCIFPAGYPNNLYDCDDNCIVNIDPCDVCGGTANDASECCEASELDCAGVCGGDAELDECGVCGGDCPSWTIQYGGLPPDDCSPECFCCDCDGEPFGAHVIDFCGDCKAPTDDDFNDCGGCPDETALNPGGSTCIALTDPTTGDEYNYTTENGCCEYDYCRPYLHKIIDLEFMIDVYGTTPVDIESYADPWNCLVGFDPIPNDPGSWLTYGDWDFTDSPLNVVVYNPVVEIGYDPNRMEPLSSGHKIQFRAPKGNWGAYLALQNTMNSIRAVGIRIASNDPNVESLDAQYLMEGFNTIIESDDDDYKYRTFPFDDEANLFALNGTGANGELVDGQIYHLSFVYTIKYGESLTDTTSYEQVVNFDFMHQSCLQIGDLNADDSMNVLDIVTLANCILAVNCDQLEFGCAGDLNGDGNWNVLDIVVLANCVLADNCIG